MALSVNEIYKQDCIKGLAKVEPSTIDLAFADPPFNIGYEYDVYHDSRSDDEYLDWSRRWIDGVWKALKPTGTFWLAIGDEYAAELKVIAQKDVGFRCRSWVLWYYTFGVNCKRAFSRSHTHLLYFVKNPDEFTFNADDPAVRVPSARQLVYADGRANPKGRLPDNTWILRPQDLPGGFSAQEDTWYFPRVAGTFKEREGFHGCQMPEQLLGRIIRCCSNPGDIVLDPFGGSGTTLTVAKKLGRQWLGFELSAEYVTRIKARLKAAAVGGPLDGAADPLASAPKTTGPGAKRLVDGKRVPVAAGGRPAGVLRNGDVQHALIDAYKQTHAGHSVDQLLADPELNLAFVQACRTSGVPGGAAEWNRMLLGVRKAGKLPTLGARARLLRSSDMDGYMFASEIAMQQLSVELDAALDDILCDPQIAGRFDEIAASFAPGHTPFEYRWAALAVRKRAKMARRLAVERESEWSKCELGRARSIRDSDWSKYECPGVYLLLSDGRQELYAGETFNLRQRIEQIAALPAWKKFAPATVKVLAAAPRCGLQSYLIDRYRPVMNCHLLLPAPAAP